MATGQQDPKSYISQCNYVCTMQTYKQHKERVLRKRAHKKASLPRIDAP